jgi:hypothetical protein
LHTSTGKGSGSGSSKSRKSSKSPIVNDVPADLHPVTIDLWPLWRGQGVGCFSPFDCVPLPPCRFDGSPFRG